MDLVYFSKKEIENRITAGTDYGLHTLKLQIYGLLIKREVKMAGYWLSSVFAFLWTKTKSQGP